MGFGPLVKVVRSSAKRRKKRLWANSVIRGNLAWIQLIRSAGSLVKADKNTAAGPPCQSPRPKIALFGIYCAILKFTSDNAASLEAGTRRRGLRSIIKLTPEPVQASSHLRKTCRKRASSLALLAAQRLSGLYKCISCCWCWEVLRSKGLRSKGSLSFCARTFALFFFLRRAKGPRSFNSLRFRFLTTRALVAGLARLKGLQANCNKPSGPFLATLFLSRIFERTNSKNFAQRAISMWG